MKTAMLGLLAETPIHPGTGRSMGVVDLPVAREAATDYPVLVGSSLKGALRDKAESIKKEDASHRFGRPDHAGDLLVSDGRLLLLPVRSLTGSYRWVTCPHLIERYHRDLSRTGLEPKPNVPDVKRGSARAAGSGSLFLEERQFTTSDDPGTELINAIKPLVLHKDTQSRLDSQIAVLNDHDFAWFVRYGLSVQARNILEKDGTKKSKNLWYEETLPPDTVMYTIVMGRSDDALQALSKLFTDNQDPYLQAGGNETVGQGWFAVSVRQADEGGTS